MARYVIALGSNQGPRRAELAMARTWLNLHGRVTAASRLYTTEPIGPGSRDYLNAALVLETDLAPLDLLALCKRWERDRGRRTPVVRWTDRPIDLDLIGWDGPGLSSPRLVLPHPALQDRRFVLAPLLDLFHALPEPLKKLPLKAFYDGAPEIRIAVTQAKW